VVLNNGTEAAILDLDASPAHIPDGTVLEDRLGVAPDVKIEGRKIRVSVVARSASIYTARKHLLQIIPRYRCWQGW